MAVVTVRVFVCDGCGESVVVKGGAIEGVPDMPDGWTISGEHADGRWSHACTACAGRA